MEELDIKKQFGRNLKKIRNQRDVTQDRLSELTTIQPQMIRQLESGKNFLSAATLASLVNALETYPMFFFAPDEHEFSTDEGIKTEIKNIINGCDSVRLNLIHKMILTLVNNEVPENERNTDKEEIRK